MFGALNVVGFDHQHGVPQQQYGKYHKAAGRSLAQRHAGRRSKAGNAQHRVGSQQHPAGNQHHAGGAGVFQVVHSAAGRRQAAPHKAQQQPQVSDLLVTAYYRTYGTPVTISRCSNNYGPYHFPEKLIPLMILNALEDKPLPVYGDGKNVRDWLYVEDHCRAIELILENGRVGEVYNVGGHHEKQNIEVVKTILHALGKSEELIAFVKDRPGHDRRYAIDPSKIHRELGWLPQTSFEDGIQTTVEWYLQKPFLVGTHPKRRL